MSSSPRYWTLKEAFSRAVHFQPDISRHSFWRRVETGELVAFGRRNLQSHRDWMPPLVCRSIIELDLDASSAHGRDWSFVDVVIYSVLRAPNPADVLDGMSLRTAFWKFVLRGSVVRSLDEKAIEISPDLARVYKLGSCDPFIDSWEWSLIRGLSKSWFGHERPIDFENSDYVAQAAFVTYARYFALMSLLRDQVLEALGDPVAEFGSPKIIPTVWSHPHYYLNVQTGDIHKKDVDSADTSQTSVKRWSAVMLKKPEKQNIFHVKPMAFDETLPLTINPVLPDPNRKLTPKWASTYQAIHALWPDGIPKGLTVPRRNDLIRRWQRQNLLSVAMDRTIDRCLKIE